MRGVLSSKRKNGQCTPCDLYAKSVCWPSLCHQHSQNGNPGGFIFSLERYNTKLSETSKLRGILMTLQARGYILNFTYGRERVNTSWENWRKCFMEIMNECIPQHLLPNCCNLPWLSKSLVQLMRRNNMLFSQAQVS